MKAYGWSEQYVRTGITGMKSWCFYYWALANERNIFGDGAVLKDGFIAQEIKRLLKKK